MIWNLANSSSALIDEDTKIDGYFVKSDGNKDVVFPLTGELDPVRKAKYEAENWSDLTEAQLEAEIPYFDSVLSVNVEDSTPSAITVENRGKNIADFTKMDHMGWASYVNNSVYKVFNPLDNNTSIFGAGSAWTWTPKNTSKMIKLKPNTDYVLSAKSCINILPSLHDFSGNWLSDSSVYNHKLGEEPLSFTTDSDYIYLDLRIGIRTGDFYIEDFQLEEGSVATDYVPPREDSITIPDTVELHGWGGNYDEWSGNQYTKRIAMTKKTTDLSANFTLSGYKLGTQVIVMKDSTGEVQVLDAAASVSTGWNETACTVWYVLSTPIVSEVKATGGLYLYEGQNNVLCPDSKLPALIMLTHTAEGTDELLAFVRNFSANARSESIRFKPHFSTKKRTILTRRGYEISFDDPIIDGDWDLRQFEDTRFTIMEELGSEKIKYHGCAITELESSDDDIVIHKVKLIAETKEVV